MRSYFGRAGWMWTLLSLSPALFVGCGGSEPVIQDVELGGATEIALTLGGGKSLNSVSYVITGPNGFSRTDSVNLASSTALAFTVGALPAGSPYSITVTGTSTDSAMSCAGTASFSVSAGATTKVALSVTCHEPTQLGSVSVNGSLNVCPVIDGMSSNPSAVYLGGTIALSALAHDSDAAPSALTYAWTATSGVLSGTSPANRTFTCTDPGSATLQLTVSDGDATCNATASIVVDCGFDASATFYTTKTPYAPRQDASTYEAPPAGFSTVFTELVARHGSRGLSSMKYDAATYNMWKKASDDGALTPLGATLGADVLKIMKANVLLDFGVSGISTPGYGNLTQVGISEQQQLAARLLQRQASYFKSISSSSGTSLPRSIVVVSSGVDRAVDSAAFFTQSLVKNDPGLAALLTVPPAPAGYPANAPVAQPAGTNRFQLYFHKLAAKTDLVTSVSDPYYTTYQDSLAFQAYQSNATLTAKVAACSSDPNITVASRALLEGVFAKSFVDKIENKTYSFANTGTYSFTSDNGLYSSTVTADGKTTVKSLADAATMLYNLYIIAPAMAKEAPVDFARYVPSAQARTLAFLQDAQDFYNMGPGIAEDGPVTYKMAQGLLDDFFKEVDSIAHGDLSHGAKLRFTHAEIIVPFASLLGLRGVFAPVPRASNYSYDTNSWRGELVSPMAANVQWDIYRDASGVLLVRMLYNEQETDFKAACDSARYTPGSHYYDYTKLAACYGHTL